MIGGQDIAELDELAPGVFCRVGRLSSMMKMNLDFSPTPVAVLRQTLKVRSVILLGGEPGRKCGSFEDRRRGAELATRSRVLLLVR